MSIEVHLTEADLAERLRHDAATGLRATPKWMPPTWFYDARGSELFEEITKLPEYYPTGAERSILDGHAADIATQTSASTVIELGSGSSDKTRLLLDALHAHGTLARFVPFDVSRSALESAADAIRTDYPDLEVHPIVADFTSHLDRVPAGDDRLVVFLGGTIGNLPPQQRAAFLRQVRSTLAIGEWLLLGTDLVKDEATLVAAYDDAAGVTAQFNLNLLAVLNRELGANFDLAGFDHVAAWDPDNAWIEMRLRARHPMTVTVEQLGMTIDFADGEELKTEISAKFSRERIADELTRAGFDPHRWWTDPAGRFGLTLARAT